MTHRTRLRRHGLFAACCIIALLTASADAVAQPQVNFKRVVNNWPTIELYFTVACDGRPVSLGDRTLFRVVEDGAELRDFTLWCPDTTQRTAASVGLVFDGSAVMTAAGNAAAKAAGHAFVDLMDTTLDEAAVLWFSNSVYTEQGMTRDRSALHDAIGRIPCIGSSALWDGVYYGLLEVMNNRSNALAALIVLSGGSDNASSRSVADVISLAMRNSVRVFTVGFGPMINRAQLQTVAQSTGGRYYETPDTAQLADLFREISTIFAGGFQECLIAYDASCMDGGLRRVDLSIVNFCGGSATRTRTYEALKDTSTFLPARLELGSAFARGDTTVTVPLRLLDTLAAGTMLHPAIFAIAFDPLCLQYAGIAVPPGSPLAGVPVTATPGPADVTIETADRRWLASAQDPVTLAELTFRTRSNTGADTIACPLLLDSWTFSAGCLRPVLRNGGIRILPSTTDIGAIPSAAGRLDLFPDPSHGTLTLRVPSRPGATVRIAVADLLGRTLFEAAETSASGLHECTVTLPPAPPGTYIVTVAAGARRFTRTLRRH